jgi:hypothetical protein
MLGACSRRAGCVSAFLLAAPSRSRRRASPSLADARALCSESSPAPSLREMTAGLPVFVGQTETSGRGLYASRAIASGEVIHAAVPIVAHPTLRNLKTRCYHCLRELRAARARRLGRDARRRRRGGGSRGTSAGVPARRRRGTRTTSWKRPRGTRSRRSRAGARRTRSNFHSPPRASRSPPRRARRPCARRTRWCASTSPPTQSRPGTGSRSTPCCASRCCAAWPWPSWARAGTRLPGPRLPGRSAKTKKRITRNAPRRLGSAPSASPR